MSCDRTSLVVCGAGGHGRVVASVARAAGWSDIVFLDPRWPDVLSAGEWRVEATGQSLAADVEGRPLIVGIGNNERRMAVLEQAHAAGLSIELLVHPTAWVCPGILPGRGTVVMPKAVINHGASLAEGVIVNTGAIVEHDCRIGAGAHISPGAVLSGAVAVGPLAWIGAGSSIRQGIRIGAGSTVGVGSSVVTDIPEGEVWAGVPARPLRKPPAEPRLSPY